MSLGSIIVRLTMNTADFETDAGRASKVAQRRAKEIDDAFRKAGNAIGLALGAGLAAAGAAMKTSIDRMDELSKASQKVGMPTEEFSRLAYAGELADVSMETLVGSLGKLTKAQAAALKETSEQAKVFDALGIAATNADGSLRPASEVLGEFADRFKAMEGSPEAMAAGFSLFGRSFQEMIPLLKDGSAGLRDAADESDRLGITLSTTAGQAAEEFNDNLTRLQRALGGAWMEIASGMLPQLVDMSGEMVIAGQRTDDLRSFGEGLGMVLRGIGDGFSFVAGMARQFGIDMATATEMARGWAEVTRNIQTFGLADGTIAGGRAKVGAALDNRKDMMRGAQRSRANAEAQANIDRMLRNGVKYDGPLLDMGTPKNDPAADYAKRLAAALAGAGGGSKGRKAAASRAPEISEEAKAMERLNEQAARDIESLKERLGLMGLETEAAKMRWEIEEGAYKALEPAKQAALLLGAQELDLKRELLEEAEKEDRARIDAERGYEDAIRAIREEGETLGMTSEQLEIYNRLKAAGVGTNREFIDSIVAETKMLQEQRKASEDQIERMDGLRSAANGFLDDLRAGEGVWDSLARAASNFAGTLADIAQRKLIEQIFGQTGSAQGGAGGGLMSLFTNFVGSLFGGGGGSASSGGGQFAWAGNGYATGGWTGPGATNQPAGIVHADEVVWSKGDVARAGGVAQVESMRRGSASVSGEAKRPLVVFSEAQMLDALAAHGGLEKVVVHYMERNRDRLRANA